MKKIYILSFVIAGLFTIGTCLSFAEEANDIYQWQIQKYPKTRREFKDIVADQSVIQEKPDAINKNFQDELRNKKIEEKKKLIEEAEKTPEAEKIAAKETPQSSGEIKAEIKNQEIPVNEEAPASGEETAASEDYSSENTEADNNYANQDTDGGQNDDDQNSGNDSVWGKPQEEQDPYTSAGY